LTGTLYNMKKSFCVFLSLAIISVSYSQRISGKLKLNQGQAIRVTEETKTTVNQEAMGQVVDFNVDGSAIHSYTVTNSTDDNSTLSHKMQRITFTFNGMGQKRNFDSDNPKDMSGQFGKPVKEILDKNYNMVIDTSGKVLMTMPEKFELANEDMLMVIGSMLKDELQAVQPPKKGNGSFFKILPEREISKGDSWTDTTNDATAKGITTYTLSGITDSTLVIDFTGNSNTISKAEFMGMETTTNLNNKTTGKIIIDRATNIIREKNSVIDSKGTTEAMGGTVPVTSKTTINIKVNSTE
jgi:hypothetical protein